MGGRGGGPGGRGGGGGGGGGGGAGEGGGGGEGGGARVCAGWLCARCVCFLAATAEGGDAAGAGSGRASPSSQRRWVASVAQSLLSVIDTASASLSKVTEAVQLARGAAAEEATEGGDQVPMSNVKYIANHSICITSQTHRFSDINSLLVHS